MGHEPDECAENRILPGRGAKMSRIEMEHPGSRALIDFWSALRGDRPAPYRAEVTAAGLGASLFAHVAVLEQIAPGDYRIRLAGEVMHEIFDMEIRGMRFDALIVDEDRGRLMALADEALARRAVAVARLEGRAPGRPGLPLELTLAPLSSDFGRIDRLLAALHPLGLAEGERIGRAARRCRMTGGALAEGAAPAHAAPLPGFAEGAAPFAMDRPALSSVAGAGDGKGARRRDHLKIVKD